MAVLDLKSAGVCFLFCRSCRKMCFKRILCRYPDMKKIVYEKRVFNGLFPPLKYVMFTKKKAVRFGSNDLAEGYFHIKIQYMRLTFCLHSSNVDLIKWRYSACKTNNKGTGLNPKEKMYSKFTMDTVWVNRLTYLCERERRQKLQITDTDPVFAL